MNDIQYLSQWLIITVLKFDLDLIVLCKLVQIEGNNANAGDAIMLDEHGYVSETNATNIVSIPFCQSFYFFT